MQSFLLIKNLFGFKIESKTPQNHIDPYRFDIKHELERDIAKFLVLCSTEERRSQDLEHDGE